MTMRTPAVLLRTLSLMLSLVAGDVVLAQDGALLDGIAAVVNDEVVTIGEVRRAALLARANDLGVGTLCAGETDTALRLGEAAVEAAAPTVEGPLSVPELEQARECLIDSRLVFREVRRFPRIAATDADLAALLADLGERYGSPAALVDELQRFGLTREELQDLLRRQLLVADYVDGRFRATVEITREQALLAWTDEFAPAMEDRGVPVPDFEAVADDFVVPILREREVNRRIQSWIRDLRDRSTIRRMYP